MLHILDISLEKYANFKKVPSLIKLYDLIVEKDPLTELYYCGNRQKMSKIINTNGVINEGFLKKCKCLKKRIETNQAYPYSSI